MTDAELLAKVKTALGITTDYQNETLKIYIDDTKAFLKSAGVKDSVLNGSASVGCIVRGVADLWNYGSGSVTFSDYFRMRAKQLSAEPGENDVTTPNMTTIIYVPSQSAELEEFGWEVSGLGLYKTFQAREFPIKDEEKVTVTITCPDGTIMQGENDTTGNRRRISLEGSNSILIMPMTKYDTEQSKFVDTDGRITILFPTICYGAEAKFATYNKG